MPLKISYLLYLLAGIIGLLLVVPVDAVRTLKGVAVGGSFAARRYARAFAPILGAKGASAPFSFVEYYYLIPTYGFNLAVG